MKKLLIATGIVSALAMTGCASTQTAENNNAHAYHNHGEHHHDMHKHHKGELVAKYTCDNDTTVFAKYNPEDETALLNITAPSLKLKNTEINTTIAPSASGSLYVNDTTNTKYKWHTKGMMGILDVTKGTTTTSFNCEAKHPPVGGKPFRHPHHHAKKGE